MKEGDIYTTNYCGDLRVVKIHSYNNVEVEFLLTGTKIKTDKWRILEGVVGDKYYPKYGELALLERDIAGLVNLRHILAGQQCFVDAIVKIT